METRDGNRKFVYRIFISHSSSDRWIAGQISKELEALRIKTWLDEKDISGGDVVPGIIIDGIHSCNEGIVLISTTSVKSVWIPFEIGALRALSKRVTPILNNVSSNALAPMKDVVSIDLNNFEQFLLQVGKRAYP